MGLVTQQDPIGIAGGLNLYGYANGDPVNFSDPFGLRACKEGAPSLGKDAPRDICAFMPLVTKNTATGDAVLDNPTYRGLIERGLASGARDALGYKLEQGGVVYQDGEHVLGRNATRENIDLPLQGFRAVAFDWHTHPNVGRARPNVPGDMYTLGASELDESEMQKNLLAGQLAGTGPHPSYIADFMFFYRLTVGAGGVDVTTVPRIFIR